MKKIFLADCFVRHRFRFALLCISVGVLAMTIIYGCSKQHFPECKQCYEITETYNIVGYLQRTDTSWQSVLCDSTLYDFMKRVKDSSWLRKDCYDGNYQVIRYSFK